MGEQTGISWCHHTKNLWWGCWKIDPECAHCYADDTANRYAPGHWGRTAPRRFFDDKNLRELLKWNRKAKEAGERRRVFVGSMMDWAEIHPVLEINAKMNERREAFWKLVPECDWLDFLMLTKRPENAAELVPWRDGSAPWPNVWIGVTAGTIHSLKTKVPVLRRIPAAVRFISCEPLLEGIPSQEWDEALTSEPNADNDEVTYGQRVHWLIVGDESGHEARPASADWVRIARDAAERHGVAFHFKQWAGKDQPGIEGREKPGKKIHLPILDGRQHAAFPEQ